MAVERTLEQLAEFIESYPVYHQPGAEHIRAVIGYLGMGAQQPAPSATR